jgi:hypothetical protein
MSEPHVDRPLVYVAGPYSHPDPVENSHMAIHVADKVEATGLVTPVIPHLSLMWHMVIPHDVDFWYSLDIAVLARCDALLRFPGASTGADDEVAFAEDNDIPVFYAQEDLIAWAETYGE